jgi:hypothetical protein
LSQRGTETTLYQEIDKGADFGRRLAIADYRYRGALRMRGGLLITAPPRNVLNSAPHEPPLSDQTIGDSSVRRSIVAVIR